MVTMDILNTVDEFNYDIFLNNTKYSLVHHYSNWSKVVTSLKEDQRYFLIAKEKDEIVGVLPLYYYKCDYGNILTTTSYHTLTGILTLEHKNKNIIYQKLLDYSIEIAKELNCFAISISNNPFIDDNDYYMKFLNPDYIMESFIQYIKLNDIFDDENNLVHQNYIKRTNLSRNIKKVYSANLQYCIDDINTKHIQKCYKIYETRMSELKSRPLPKNIFISIFQILKENAKSCSIIKEDNIVANSIFLHNNNIGNMYTLSQDSEYKNLSCNYFLTFEIIKWSVKNQLKIFNWMSSPKKYDGVYRWKEQWGSQDTNLYYYTKFLSNENMDFNEDDFFEINKYYGFHYLAPYNLLFNKDKKIKYTTKNDIYSYVNKIIM